MRRRSAPSVALTIAGSDSGGGAGIQADLRVFHALGVHGATAITCVTAQNQSGVRALQPCRPELVRQQIEAVFGGPPPAAVKTGMLHSAAIIRGIAGFFQAGGRPPLVVDPVMVATSGARLLQPGGVAALKKSLLPLATLVTPNLDEAETLVAGVIRTEAAMREAARTLHGEFGCAVLVKGGHLPDAREAVDWFWDGETELRLAGPYLKGLRTHGTGCAYSAAIAAYLALGHDLKAAVRRAKAFMVRVLTARAREQERGV